MSLFSKKVECSFKRAFLWGRKRLSCNSAHILGLHVHSSRVGLVIGHTGHFPGGLTHLRGRQKFFFFFFTITQGQPVADWFVSCIDRVNHPITMRCRRSDDVFCSAYIKIAGRRRRGEQLNQ